MQNVVQCKINTAPQAALVISTLLTPLFSACLDGGFGMQDDASSHSGDAVAAVITQSHHGLQPAQAGASSSTIADAASPLHERNCAVPARPLATQGGTSGQENVSVANSTASISGLTSPPRKPILRDLYRPADAQPALSGSTSPCSPTTGDPAARHASGNHADSPAARALDYLARSAGRDLAELCPTDVPPPLPSTLAAAASASQASVSGSSAHIGASSALSARQRHGASSHSGMPAAPPASADTQGASSHHSSASAGHVERNAAPIPAQAAAASFSSKGAASGAPGSHSTDHSGIAISSKRRGRSAVFRPWHTPLVSHASGEHVAEGAPELATLEAWQAGNIATHGSSGAAVGSSSSSALQDGIAAEQVAGQTQAVVQQQAGTPAAPAQDGISVLADSPDSLIVHTVQPFDRTRTNTTAFFSDCFDTIKNMVEAAVKAMISTRHIEVWRPKKYKADRRQQIGKGAFGSVWMGFYWPAQEPFLTSIKVCQQRLQQCLRYSVRALFLLPCVTLIVMLMLPLASTQLCVTYKEVSSSDLHRSSAPHSVQHVHT